MRKLNTSSDAAETTVKMCMEGFEIAAKITGSAAKNIAVLLYTAQKKQTNTKGKTSLSNMLKINKELKVFSLKKEDLKTFIAEAKRYGVLFCTLVDKSKDFDDVDILVRAEDASKIDRIVEKFKLSVVNTADIRNEMSKSKDSKNKDFDVSVEDEILDEILSKATEKGNDNQSNPSSAKTVKDPQSEPSSKSNNISEAGTKKKEKTSVREELKNIQSKLKEKYGLDNSKETLKDNGIKGSKHINPKIRKKKHNKEKGL